MRVRSGPRIVVALAGGLFLASFLAAQDRSRAGDLESIRGEIRELEKRLEAANRKESGLAGRLTRLDLELDLQVQRLSEAKASRAVLNERIERSSTALIRLEEELQTARGELKRRVAGLYRLGRLGYLRLFTSMRSEADLIQGLRLLRFLARRDGASIERAVSTSAEVSETKRRLVSRREAAEKWAAEEVRRRKRLTALRRDQSRLLAATRRERETLAARNEELLRKERRLSELIGSLGGEELLSGRQMQDFKGALDWPLEGHVAIGFGPRLDPRYGTQVPHNGIEIAARPGDVIRAVFGGRVLFSAPFESYGPTVVLLHPGRVFTLYAGLESLRVEKDQEVRLGETVGLAGARLYFEVRVDNRPRDPLVWLR